jgi:hypothetical protein
MVLIVLQARKRLPVLKLVQVHTLVVVVHGG